MPSARREILSREFALRSPELISTPPGLEAAGLAETERSLDSLALVPVPTVAPIFLRRAVSFPRLAAPAPPAGTEVPLHGNYYATHTTRRVCLQIGSVLSLADGLRPSARLGEDLPNPK